VFNFTNFWDGRASPFFNGKGTFGAHDGNVTILVNRPGQGLVKERVLLNNASLASQSLQPPSSPVEMSFDLSPEGMLRGMPEIGQKLLRPSDTTGKPLVPLGLQDVHPQDSVLGTLSKKPFRGLSTSYKKMIEKAFSKKYWNSTEMVELPSTPSTTKFTQMEANFSLFFGLSMLMYESTLVADYTPFDQWMETGHLNRYFNKRELAGLNLFVNEGKCVSCHAGPELSKASVREAQGGKNLIRAMAIADGKALYDNGFYNTSVTPSTDDAGRGDLNINNQPLASSRQALYDRLGIDMIKFPILGNDHIPAVDEDFGSPVCIDTNNNGVCDPTEEILPEFKRVAVDGAFKTPGLRNSKLTGPYFHNGGMATLRQVVQFYNRGGNFCRFNRRDIDRRIEPLGLTDSEEEQLVAFLESLTDQRVQYQQAPFDHPELKIPDNGLDTTGRFRLRAVGSKGSYVPLSTFLNLNPQDAIYTPPGICTTD
jgi:cytochrome c peroxidase